jgi:hypothetical protein
LELTNASLWRREHCDNFDKHLYGGGGGGGMVVWWYGGVVVWWCGGVVDGGKCESPHNPEHGTLTRIETNTERALLYIVFGA